MTKFVAASHEKVEKVPQFLPAEMYPVPPGGDLGLRGMRVRLMRRREVIGTATTSYDHRALGARVYVVLDNGCSAWVSVDDVEPLEEE